MQHILDNRTKQINYEANIANAPLEGITGSPVASEKDKAAAQLQILINNRSALLKEMGEVEKAISETDATGGNDTKLLEKRKELWVQILGLVNQVNNQAATADERASAKVVSDLSKLAGVFNSIGDSVSGMNEKLGTSLKFIGSMVTSLSSAKQSLVDFNKAKDQKDAVGQIAGIGGIIAGVAGIAGSIVGVFTKAAEERKKLLAEMQQFQTGVFTGEIQINELYRQRTLEQAKLNKLRIDGINAEIAALQAYKPQIQSDYDKVLSELQKQTAKVITKKFISVGYTQEGEDKQIQKLLDSGLTIDQINAKYKNLSDTFANISLKNLNYSQLEDLFTKGQLDDKARALFTTLQALKKEGLDVDKALEEAKAKSAEIFTGTTAQSLADAIKDGLKNGYKSVADFGDNLEETFRNAILSGFEAREIEGRMQDFYKQLDAAAESNGGLDQAEIEALRKLYKEKAQEIIDRFNQEQQITGQSFGATSQSNSLQGSIKASLTEDTSTILAGTLKGMQYSAAKQLDVSMQSLQVQQRIENNTALTVKRLEDTITELVKANRNWQDAVTGARPIKVIV